MAQVWRCSSLVFLGLLLGPPGPLLVPIVGVVLFLLGVLGIGCAGVVLLLACCGLFFPWFEVPLILYLVGVLGGIGWFVLAIG